jgi:Tol biopolymer transport system component
MRSHWRSASRASVTVVLMISAFVVLAVLLLAACGGSDATPSTSPSAAVSGDGATPLPTPTVAGTIAFSNRAENEAYPDIYVVNADGTGLTQLTDDPGGDDHPSWSPDGKEIVYSILPPESDSWECTVWVMNADGSGKREVSKQLAKGCGGLWPTWSPDGKQIAFSRMTTLPSLDVCVMNADGSGLKCVFTPGKMKEVFGPSWTPDGKILFLKDGNVFSVNPDGSGLVPLTKGRSIRGYALSPDGKRIAVHDLVSLRAEVTATPGGGDRVTLLDPVSDFITYDPFVAPAWTPDGKALALASSSDRGSTGSRLYIINADGSGLSAVPGIDHALEPAWRPE